MRKRKGFKRGESRAVRSSNLYRSLLKIQSGSSSEREKGQGDCRARLGSPQGHDFPNQLPCFNPSKPPRTVRTVRATLAASLPASSAPHLCPFRPIVLARQREKLNELGSWMLPNGRTAQMQPFLALLCVRVRLRGIVLLGPVQEKQLISDTICGNQLKPKKRTEIFSPFLETLLMRREGTAVDLKRHHVKVLVPPGFRSDCLKAK